MSAERKEQLSKVEVRLLGYAQAEFNNVVGEVIQAHGFDPAKAVVKQEGGEFYVIEPLIEKPSA